MRSATQLPTHLFEALAFLALYEEDLQTRYSLIGFKQQLHRGFWSIVLAEFIFELPDDLLVARRRVEVRLFIASAIIRSRARRNSASLITIRLRCTFALDHTSGFAPHVESGRAAMECRSRA